MNHYSGHDPERGCALMVAAGIAVVVVVIVLVLRWA